MNAATRAEYTEFCEWAERQLALKSYTPCRDDQGQFASCGVGSSARERRQGMAQRRKRRGPSSGAGPRSRAANRRRRGRHRASQRQFEQHATSADAPRAHRDLHRGHVAERRELAQRIREDRKESREAAAGDRKELVRDLKKERQGTRKEQKKDRARLVKEQERATAKLERTQAKQREKLTEQQAAERAKVKDPDGLTERHARQTARQAHEHASEHRELRSDQRQERQDFRERQRDDRDWERTQHRDQLEEHRSSEQSARNDLHLEHREAIHELRAQHRQERAEQHRSDREDRHGGDDDEHEGKSFGVGTETKALVDLCYEVLDEIHADLNAEDGGLAWKAGKKPKRTGGKPSGRKPRGSGKPNCGIDEHGFMHGNHCQTGGHGGAAADGSKPAGHGKIGHHHFALPEHGPGIDRKLAIKQAATKAEHTVANALRGRQVGDYDPLRQKQNPAYDVHLNAKQSPSGREEFVEVKYKSEGKKNSLSVHADALIRKAEHHEEAKDAGFSTILIDVRDRSFGGTEAEHYQGHGIYFRRGAGAYSTANMYRAKDMDEVRRLMAMPEDQLPELARGSMPKVDAKLREQAKKVEESRKRRDAGGKKEARRRAWIERRDAGLLGTAVSAKPSADR